MTTPTPNPLHVIHTITAGTKTANPLPDPPQGRTLQRIWTLINPDRLPELGPMHNVTAFLEDNVHDYQIKNGTLRYYSRVTETGASVQIVLDYETTLERNARLQDLSQKASAAKPQQDGQASSKTAPKPTRRTPKS